MTAYVSILRSESHDASPIRSEGDLRERLSTHGLNVVTRACRPEDLTSEDCRPGQVYVLHESGRCWFEGEDSGASHDLFALCGYDRIRDAYASQIGAAPIQIRSTIPYVLSGILPQFVPFTPNQIVERIAAGTPFLMERGQMVSALLGCIRQIGSINARLARDTIPEGVRIRLQDLISLRLAAERATDRGLLLSRIDNAILSGLHALTRRDGEASIAAIAEWIGERIDEQHAPNAILGALGTLGWRGFTALRMHGEVAYYAITPSGCHALRSEVGKLAALHREIVEEQEGKTGSPRLPDGQAVGRKSQEKRW